MEPPLFRCRPAQAGDVGAIIDCQAALALESEGLTLDGQTLAQGVRSVFRNPALGRYFVAESGGQVVGTVMLTTEWSDWRNGVVWWLQSVYVIPQFRQKGVLRALCVFVKRLADSDESVRGLRLYVHSLNEVASIAYLRLGLEDGRYRVFEWMKSF